MKEGRRGLVAESRGGGEGRERREGGGDGEEEEEEEEEGREVPELLCDDGLVAELEAKVTRTLDH
jgi:hypothetical protein